MNIKWWLLAVYCGASTGFAMLQYERGTHVRSRSDVA